MSDEVKTEVNTQKDKQKHQYVTKYGFDRDSGKWDLILKVEGVSVFVMRVVLDMCSPVFEKWIQDEKETKNSQVEIDVQDTTCEDFIDFLRCFYPGKDHELTDVSVFRILPLAWYYQVEQVVKQCGQYLLTLVESEKTSRELLVRCMDAAYDHNLTKVKEESKRRLVCMELKMCDVPFRSIGSSETGNTGLPKNLSARIDVYEQCIPELRYEIKQLHSKVSDRDYSLEYKDQQIQIRDRNIERLQDQLKLTKKRNT